MAPGDAMVVMSTWLTKRELSGEAVRSVIMDMACVANAMAKYATFCKCQVITDGFRFN